MRSLIIVLAIATTIVACRKEPQEEIPASRSGYTTIAVQNGGTISGRVTVSPVPAVPPLDVVHDNDVCGKTKATPRLVTDANGGVANAVVYLAEIKQGKALAVPQQPVHVGQHMCMYEPHVTIAPVGATLAVSNDDEGVLHNVHMLKGDTTDWNQAQPVHGQINNHLLKHAGTYHLRCDAGHIWMSGWVWVVDHPYYALTDAEGDFVLSDVPPGDYALVCWHEGWNATARRDDHGELTEYRFDGPYEIRATVHVDAGATTTHAFTIQPR
jgi:plastocyanin